jgi:hypothetical protein
LAPKATASHLKSTFNKWALLRILIPSWRFFEDLGDVPELLYRTKDSSGLFSPWLPCLKKPKRGIGSLFLNAKGNLFLASQSLLDQTIHHINDCKSETDFSETTSYQMILQLVAQTISSQKMTGIETFQFKIHISGNRLSDSTTYEALISMEHPLP